MRINYSDEEDFPGQYGLWQGNCRRSLRSKAGQRELRELEAALLAMPAKRLIHGSLTDDEGGMCAIACYAKHKGTDLSNLDPEYESDAVGIAAGMPRLVAWSVVAENDVTNDYHYETAEGPTMHYGHGEYQNRGVWLKLDYTPEERYARVLAWVRSNLNTPTP